MNDFTLKQAISKLSSNQISSQELVSACLSQIQKHDKKINAFVSVEKSSTNRKPKPGPLSGIPICVKDNFLTQNLKTTASSKVLEDYLPQYESTVTSKLKQAGAIIIGKNNMDAWAHGSSTETSDFGPTKNPRNTNYLPGGSSGGTAAAVVSDMAIAGIGSETAGSIRQPAAWSGCVGLKPTYGRVSRYGVIAMGSSLDSPGPMTKTVEDAAILLGIIAGKDNFDATTSPSTVPDFTKKLKSGVKGLKIALAKNYLLPEMDSKVKNLITSAAKELQTLGAHVEEINIMNPSYAISVYTIVQRSEVSSNLARYDGIRFGNSRNLMGEEAKRRIILGTHVLSSGYYDAYYKKAQKVRSLYIEDFAKTFKKYDVVISPTSPGPAKKIGASKGQAMFGEMEDMLLEPSSLAGLPGISLPAGFINNLPIGLNIVGPKFSEATVLQVAHAYEQATTWHQKKPNL